MTIQSAPYYWIVCDVCGVKSTEESDFSAWQDENQAQEEALACDWTLTDDGRWLCHDCRISHDDDYPILPTPQDREAS